MALTKIDDRGLNTPIDLLDNEKIRFGTGNDLEAYHSSSDNNSYIQHTNNGTSLIVKSDYFVVSENQSTDVVIRAAAGTAELYYNNAKKLETYTSGCYVYGRISLQGAEDGDAILEMFADEGDDAADKWRLRSRTNGYFSLEQYNGSSWETAISAVGGGSVELYHNNVKTFHTTSSGIIVQGAEGGDGNIYLYADEGDDDADQWLMQSNASGGWYLKSAPDGAWETNIKAVGNGAVELYYNNARKLRTTSTGIAVEDHIDLDDDHKLRIGSGGDLEIYHDGSKSYLVNGEGNLEIQNSSRSIDFKSDSFTVKNGADNEWMITASANGAVELYYNNVRKLYTDNGGVIVQGNLYLSDADDRKAMFGAGQDLQIWHDGSTSFIKNTTGDFIIENTGTGNVQINPDNTGTGILLTKDAGVTLYYDGASKIEATSSGATVTGNLVLGDANKVSMNSDVFKVYHSTNAAIINESGDLIINENVSDKAIIISTGSGPTERMRMKANGEILVKGQTALASSTTVNGGTTDDFRIGLKHFRSVYYDTSEVDSPLNLPEVVPNGTAGEITIIAGWGNNNGCRISKTAYSFSGGRSVSERYNFQGNASGVSVALGALSIDADGDIDVTFSDNQGDKIQNLRVFIEYFIQQGETNLT